MTAATLIVPAAISTFAPESKVWMYQSSRPFTAAEITEINTRLSAFAEQWTAHNKQLQAAGFVMLDRIIVLMVDESKTMASGCSIDTSVHFIQSLEKQYHIDLFDRMLVNYFDGEQWHTTHLHNLRDNMQSGAITPETPVVNPLVQTRSAFMEGSIVPARDCWIGDFLQ